MRRWSKSTKAMVGNLQIRYSFGPLSAGPRNYYEYRLQEFGSGKWKTVSVSGSWKVGQKQFSEKSRKGLLKEVIDRYGQLGPSGKDS